MIEIEILYTTTLNNAIKCKMDRRTIANLKRLHEQQIEQRFRWTGYKALLKKLNGYYKESI